MARQAEARHGRQPRLPLFRVSGTGRVWVLNLVLALAAAGFYLTSIRELPRANVLAGSGLQIPWWILAVLFYASEVFVVHFQFRRDAHSMSLSEIPLVLGLFFTSPQGLVLAQVIGAAAALAYHRRQSLVKLVFNMGSLALSSSAAVLIFQTMVAHGDPLGHTGWIAVFLATMASSTLAVVAVTIVISLSEGTFKLHQRPQAVAMALGTGVTNTSLALIGVMILWREPTAAWLLLVPTAMLFLSYRLYTAERQKHDSLESLYSATQGLQQSLKLQASIQSLLTRAQEMFRAEAAEITLFGEEPGEPALRTSLDPEQKLAYMIPVELDPTEGVWARVASEDTAVLVARPIANDRLRNHFEERGMRDAMVAPLHGEGTVTGIMTVGNRLGDVTTFDAEDLKLFETLANHASVSVQNARLIQQLEESLAHLTELNRLKDDFVAAVSHELRTPLTSIQGYVKTLLRPNVKWPADQQQDFLETIDRQADRLRNLIEDLLTVSRIEADREAPSLIRLSLPDMSREIAKDRDALQDHLVTIEFGADFPEILTDESLVQQILSNLIDNAVKYTPAGSTITIEGRSEEQNAVISVRDEGDGIPAELHEKIFDRFYQVDQSSTRQVGGTGLGLYICRKLATAVGGHVWLEKSDENGSVFSLRIPLRPTRLRGSTKNVGSPALYVVEGGGAAAAN